MDKNEILEKSRKENRLYDEGIQNARERGDRWGIIGFLSLICAVILYNLILRIDNILPDIFLLGFLTCQALGRYGARREKFCLILGGLGAVGTAATLALYVMDTLPR